MPDISPDYWLDTRNWLTARWAPVEDDVIGGWSVIRADDHRTPAEGAVSIASFCTQDVAEHMATFHNRWLAGELYIEGRDAGQVLADVLERRVFDVEHDVS